MTTLSVHCSLLTAAVEAPLPERLRLIAEAGFDGVQTVPPDASTLTGFAWAGPKGPPRAAGGLSSPDRGTSGRIRGMPGGRAWKQVTCQRVRRANGYAVPLSPSPETEHDSMTSRCSPSASTGPCADRAAGPRARDCRRAWSARAQARRRPLPPTTTRRSADCTEAPAQV